MREKKHAPTKLVQVTYFLDLIVYFTNKYFTRNILRLMQYKKEKSNDNFPIFFLFKFQVVFVDTIIFQALRFSSSENGIEFVFSKRVLSHHAGKIHKHFTKCRRGVNLLFRHGRPPVHRHYSLFFPPNNKISIIGARKKIC